MLEEIQDTLDRIEAIETYFRWVLVDNEQSTGSRVIACEIVLWAVESKQNLYYLWQNLLNEKPFNEHGFALVKKQIEEMTRKLTSMDIRLD